MTNTTQKFIDDITVAISQVSKMPSSNYLVVYDIYKSLYNRYRDLDEAEFADYRFYNEHLRNISPEYSLEDNMTLSMLLNAHPDYLKDGFPLMIISLISLREIIYSIGTNQQ
jgi:hypothetical protein